MNIFNAFKKQGSGQDQEKATEVGMDEIKTENQEQAQAQPEANAQTAAPQTTEGQEQKQSLPIVAPGSVEEQIKGALRQVYDPEIGLEVIPLGLIREINLNAEPPELKMVLTTPFCPYGGWLIQQVKDVAQQVVGKQIKMTVLPDLWDPNYMEDPGLLMGW